MPLTASQSVGSSITPARREAAWPIIAPVMAALIGIWYFWTATWHQTLPEPRTPVNVHLTITAVFFLVGLAVWTSLAKFGIFAYAALSGRDIEVGWGRVATAYLLTSLVLVPRALYDIWCFTSGIPEPGWDSGLGKFVFHVPLFCIVVIVMTRRAGKESRT